MVYHMQVQFCGVSTTYLNPYVQLCAAAAGLQPRHCLKGKAASVVLLTAWRDASVRKCALTSVFYWLLAGWLLFAIV
jgi:hypothetical protein